VYEGIHPLTGRKIIYGQHVSRAARIEPISVAGEIYASEQFVALLKAEENVASHLAQATNSPFVEKYCPEYVGILELPKKFGHHAIYHLRLK
jgi:class 3 adenylate cyclase